MVIVMYSIEIDNCTFGGFVPAYLCKYATSTQNTCRWRPFWIFLILTYLPKVYFGKLFIFVMSRYQRGENNKDCF